jgi:O-antigen/teichoic acid export membrane protein
LAYPSTGKKVICTCQYEGYYNSAAMSLLSVFLSKMGPSSLSIVNYSAYAANTLIAGLTSLFAIPLFLSLFGAAAFGNYSIIVTTVSLVLLTVSAPLTPLIFRFGPTSQGKQYINDIFRLFGLLCVPATLLAAGIVWWNTQQNWAVGLSLLLIPLMGFYQLYQSCRQAHRAVSHTVGIELIRNVVFVGVPLLCFHKGIGLHGEAMVLGLLLSYGLATPIALFALRRDNFLHLSATTSVWSSSQQLISKSWAFSGPMLLWFLLAQLLNSTDRYMISYFMGAAALGIYAAVYDLFYKGATLILAPVSTVLYPQLVERYEAGATQTVDQLIKRGVFIQGIIGAVMLSGVALFGGYAAERWLPNLANGQLVALALPVLAATVVWQTAITVQKHFELHQQIMPMVWACLVATVVNVVTNLVFLPDRTIVVAAYTTLLGSSIYLLSILYALWRR